MTPFFVIAGATAVGKTELAVDVAKRSSGEIISADAFQIYRGLEVLTAKPAPALLARVPHHLVGEIPLTEPSDAARFAALAEERMRAIQARGRLIMVVGGTGLYLRALTHGLADLPAADAALRAELSAQPLPELAAKLLQRDPAAAAFIDLRNPRRVVRALEICLLTGHPFSSFREQWSQPAPHVRGVILTRDRADLQARIEARTRAMFAAGVEEEVRACGEVGPTASQMIGLAEIRARLAGKIDREECIAAIQQATRRYAKRQGTWFRREARQMGFAEINLSTERHAGAMIAQIQRAASA